jgi:UV DNA damage endonuclease
MVRNHLGYACINQTLSDSKDICTNRTLRLRALEEKGLEYLAELITGNLSALQEVLEWNYEKGFKLYRMSSEMFPFYSKHYH